MRTVFGRKMSLKFDIVLEDIYLSWNNFQIIAKQSLAQN